MADVCSHIAPMTRDVLSTSYAELQADEHGQVPTDEELYGLYQVFSAKDCFEKLIHLMH